MNRLVYFMVCLVVFLSPLTISAYAEEAFEHPLEYAFKLLGDKPLTAYQFNPPNVKQGEKYPAVVIFHGGGWAYGEPKWGFSKARHFASLGLVAIVAEYRLIDNKSITPLESMADARDLIRWLRWNAERLNVDPNRIAAYGWSAGAHLASSAAVFNQDDLKHRKSGSPNLLLMKSPALVLTDDRWFQSILLDRAKAVDVSPGEHIRKGLPPSIIVTGETDTVTPLAGIQKYHKEMLKHGNESELIVYKNVGHLFTPSSEPDGGQPNPDKEVLKKAENAIDHFLKKHGYIK